jgi:hypothetical protein
MITLTDEYGNKWRFTLTWICGRWVVSERGYLVV